MKLEDKVVFVTGAAGAQGRVAVRRFLDEGARVVAGDIDATALDGLRTGLQSAPGGATDRLLTVACDVASEPSVERAMTEASAWAGRLDGLYNNAGMNNGGRLEAERDRDVANLALEIWSRMMAVNLTGVFLCSKHAVPALRRSGGGAIVNVSSTAGLRGNAISGHAYAASKGGVNALTRSMAAAYAKDGIRVNAICPGTLEEVMVTGIPRDTARHEMLQARFPLGRLGTAGDVVDLAVFLLSAQSDWMTGTVIPVDGGMTAVSQ